MKPETEAGAGRRVGVEEHLELMNDYATQAALLRDALEALEQSARILDAPAMYAVQGPCWCTMEGFGPGFGKHTVGCQLARGVLERAAKMGVRK